MPSTESEEMVFRSELTAAAEFKPKKLGKVCRLYRLQRGRVILRAHTQQPPNKDGTMAPRDSKKGNSVNRDGNREAGRIETRIDAAHVSPAQRSQTSESAEVHPVVAGAESGAVGAQIQAQADQLAAYLRSRQHSVDQREAEVNARLAVLDSEGRRERLALSHHESQLAEREEALTLRERELEERLGSVATAEEAAKEHRVVAEAEMTQQQRALQRREEALSASEQASTERLLKREEALKEADAWLKEQQEEHRRATSDFDDHFRRTENEILYQRQQLDAHRAASLDMIRRQHKDLERQRASLEGREKQWENAASRPSAAALRLEKSLRQEEAALKKRRSKLDEAELKLAEAQAKSALLRERLREARQQFREELRDERRRLALEQREASAELQKKRDGLARRSRYVDNCHAKLVQLRAELGEMHRETLDVRLATEELWVQLSGTTPPAALAQSLSEMRSRLSQHYRESAADLGRQKSELETAREEMAEQLEAVMKRKREVDAWACHQEEELQQQAKRLRDREAEIQRRETDLDDATHLRESERLAFEAEIHHLRRRVAEIECDALAVPV